MTERDIFLALLDIPDPAGRAAHLDQACGGDAGLRERVERLVRSHEAAGSFLGTPAVAHEADRAATRAFDPNAEYTPDDEALGFLAPPGRPDSLGRIGHYEVLEVLGRGGFGIVFRAFDDVLHRVVAVKVLAPQMAATSPARKRFLREARSSAQVHHENVVQIHATGEQPLPFLVMEFVAGATLQQRLDRTGPLDVAEVLRVGKQVAEGLAAAHAKGLVHRDIKPANVLIEDGPQPRVRITDFGLARAADDASISQSGVVAGTPMYMAPEQARGDALDHRADLFSLGSVLYVMLTGRPPFRAANTLAVLKRVAEEDPRPIREVIPEVPEWLCRIVEKLHAKNPDDRFQTAAEVADLLGQHLAHLQQPQAVPMPAAIVAPGALVRPRRRGRWLVPVVLVILAVGVVLGAAYASRHGWENTYNYFTKQSLVRVTVSEPVERVIISGNGRQVYHVESGLAILSLPEGRYEVQVVTREGYVATQMHSDVDGYGPTGSWNSAPRNRSFGLIVQRGSEFGISFTAEKVVPPESDAVRALRELVAAKEHQRNVVKKRYDAGMDSEGTLIAAESDLTEARVRLAEAQGNQALVRELLRTLVGHRKSERTKVELRVEAGVEPPAALNAADARVADAESRLATANGLPPAPPKGR